LSVVAVAGAGGGLGPHVVRAMSEAGHDVAAGDRVELDLEVDSSAVDLLADGGAEAWAAHVKETFGGCDAFVHLVGGWKGGQGIEDFPAEDAEWLYDLLVRTVMNASRAFLPLLKASGHGRFLLVSSPQADRPTGTNAAYGATKAAAEAWTLAVADELSEHGGTANIVRVNAIVTPQMREANPDKKYETFTSAEDLAATLAWLLTPEAAKMQGQRLALHG
jgi:NAD(P)-dependent dehydrogenase (short-subunit alcohol dehydrogenase family)